MWHCRTGRERKEVGLRGHIQPDHRLEDRLLWREGKETVTLAGSYPGDGLWTPGPDPVTAAAWCANMRVWIQIPLLCSAGGFVFHCRPCASSAQGRTHPTDPVGGRQLQGGRPLVEHTGL